MLPRDPMPAAQRISHSGAVQRLSWMAQTGVLIANIDERGLGHLFGRTFVRSSSTVSLIAVASHTAPTNFGLSFAGGLQRALSGHERALSGHEEGAQPNSSSIDFVHWAKQSVVNCSWPCQIFRDQARFGVLTPLRQCGRRCDARHRSRKYPQPQDV